jgi:uncharacterized protein YgiM (DUF1202 family)
MKKLMAVLMSGAFLTAMASSAVAGGRYYHGYPSYHHHGVHYVHSGDCFAALGFGILAGVILSDIFYPPQTAVVYHTPVPAPVVVNHYYPAPSPYYTAPPPPPEQGVTEKVTVTVEELNVRTGPGLEHPVSGRVQKGEILELVGRTPGWFAVKTPSGLYGWVMDKYTALQAQPLG